MINFNEPPYTGNELKYMKEAFKNLWGWAVYKKM